MDRIRARTLLGRCLRRDADLHTSAPSQMGQDFDLLDAEAPRTDRDVVIALAFWDAWLDEQNHNFPGFYDGISSADWPALGRSTAAALEAGASIGEPKILEHFTFKPRRRWRPWGTR